MSPAEEEKYFSTLEKSGSLDPMGPAEDVEGGILAHFDVSVEHLRQSGFYDPATHSYILSGLGGTSACEVVAAEQSSDSLEIEYESFQDDVDIGKGTVEVELDSDGGYTYRSAGIWILRSIIYWRGSSVPELPRRIG